MKEKIIIVGAGAAGLMAAKELSSKNKQIILLEARERLGGRIFTIADNNFSAPVEAGAEFVHGKLPITLSLLKDAGIPYHAVKGKMRTVKNGEWIKEDQMGDDWNDLEEKLKTLQHDMTFANFLNEYFNDEKYNSLRKHAQQYAEGFDLADINKVSTFALRNEWLHEDQVQYRITNGYNDLVKYLEDECIKNGVEIFTNIVVKNIEWKNKQVKITTVDKKKFIAERCIITVPLGILVEEETKAAINFQPKISTYINAAKQIGYGSVIKIMLEFKTAFWEKYESNLGFIFSEEIFRVWWTQQPSKQPMLTGWLGGPKAEALKNETEASILQLGLHSLSKIFLMSDDEIEKLLIGFCYHNWTNDEFALGAYSYAMPETKQALQILMQPINDTLYFAGEAIYNGESPGTVEAALDSGKQAAERIW